MKSKYLFQAFVLLAVLFSTIGGAQAVQAQEPDPVIVVREFTFWDATYTGYVDDTRYEKWPFVLDAEYDFSVTVTPTSGDLSPLLTLMDDSGTELATGVGVLNTTQPAGNYFVQVQPEAGTGFYELMIRQETVVEPVDPAVSASVSSDNIDVDGTAAFTVGLDNVPAEGYASAEFTCTYDPAMLAVSNIAFTELFGTDPASAINDPQTGTFIVAIAGSNAQRAMASGAAFTFDVTGLQVGQATVTCSARVSMGDEVLTDLAAVDTTITVNDVVVVLDGTVDGQVFATKAVTVELYDEASALVTSAVAAEDGTFSLTAPAGTYTVMAFASGFLGAQGPAVVTAGESTAKTPVALVAGDIDGNGVIDQYDAMTIGMSYNTATPEAADLNADGNIDVLDLEILAANYRAAGALDWQ